MAKQDKPQTPSWQRPIEEQPPMTIETVEIVPAEQVPPAAQVKPLTQADLPSGMVGSVVDSAIAAASDAAKKGKG